MFLGGNSSERVGFITFVNLKSREAHPQRDLLLKLFLRGTKGKVSLSIYQNTRLFQVGTAEIMTGYEDYNLRNL